MLKILSYIFVVLILFVVYVKYLEKKSVFFPDAKLKATPADAGLEYDDVHFETKDQVTLHGWLVKVKHDPQKAPTLLFLHGNAGNIGDRVDKVRFFHELDMNVFIIDYRGYGRSEGRPTESGVYRDARDAFDYLKSREDIGQDIIVYGASLGGAVAIDLAVHRPVKALIVDSSFTSAADMAKVILPVTPAFLLSVKWDSKQKIKELDIPKLFFHSREDKVVPYPLGRRLFEAAPEPKEFFDIDGGHNDGYFESLDLIREKMQEFLQRHKVI